MEDYIKIEDLILWLEIQKYGYLLDDKKTWVNYGDLDDPMMYDEDKLKWQLSRNQFINEAIHILKYEDISELIKDFKNN